MLIRAAIFFLTLSIAPAFGASDSTKLDSLFAINLGRDVNLNCNLINSADRQKLEWNVALTNIAVGNTLGRAKTLITFYKARKAAKTKPYANCGKKSTQSIQQAQVLLEGAKYNHLKTEYQSPDSYYHLIIERVKRINVGLLIEKKCAHTKNLSALMKGAEHVGSLTKQLLDNDIATGAVTAARHEMLMFPIQKCGKHTLHKVADATIMLQDLIKLVQLDLQSLNNRDEAKAPSARGSSSAPRYKYPSANKIQLSVNDNGFVKIGMREPYSGGANRIQEIFRKTLKSTQQKAHRNSGSHVTALVPRFGMSPLGTVFKKPVKGFGAEFDETPAHVLQRHAIKERIPAGLLATMSNTQTVMHMLKNRKVSPDKLVAALVRDSKDGLMAVSGIMVADGIEIEYLPADAISNLLPSIQVNMTEENKIYYMVLDTIVRTRRVAYIIHPAHLTNTFEPADFEKAAEQRSDIFQRDDIYIISRKWKQPRVVAVGFSILGLTKAGKMRSRIGLAGTNAEAFLALAKKMPSILFKEL